MKARYGKTSDEGQNLLYYGLLAVLFLSPLMRGLYFDNEMLIVSMAVAMLFGIYIWAAGRNGVGDRKVRLQLIDYGVAGLLIAYLISTFVAVKIAEAVDSDLRLAVYLMVYIITAGLANSRQRLKEMLVAIYASGVVVAFIGLLAFGGVDINGAIIANRISSTFQYPNVLGMYLAVIGIIGIYLLFSVDQVKYRLLIASANVLVFTALFGTASRGTFVSAAVVYLLYVLIQPKGYRISTLMLMFKSFLTGGIIAALISDKLGDPGIWVFVFAGAVAGAGLYYLLERFVFSGFGPLTGINRRITFIMLGVIAAALVTAVFVLPDNQMLERLTQISLKERNVVERGYFYSDALKIIHDYPLIGTGGGGWSSIYKAYQSYGYLTKQVHNFYLQTWVEAGIPGIVSLIAMWVGALILYWKTRKSQNLEDSLIAAAVAACAAMIGLQSTIDFTMAYGAIGILLWVLLAMLRNISISVISAEGGRGWKIDIKHFRPIGLAVAIIVSIFSTSFLISLSNNEKALEAMRNKDFYQRQEYLEKAVLFNPLNADHYGNLATMERALFSNTKEEEHIQKALEYSNIAIERNMGSLSFRVEKINVLFAMKNIDEVLKEVESASQLAPWSQETYNLLAYTYLSAGKYYAEAGETAKAKAYFEKTLDMPKVMKRKMDSLTEEEKALWIATPHLTLDKKLQQYMAQAVVNMKPLS